MIGLNLKAIRLLIQCKLIDYKLCLRHDHEANDQF